MKLSTEMLTELLAPATLEDTLLTLKQKGVISTYKVGAETTVIVVSGSYEIAQLLQEEMERKK